MIGVILNVSISHTLLFSLPIEEDSLLNHFQYLGQVSVGFDYLDIRYACFLIFMISEIWYGGNNGSYFNFHDYFSFFSFSIYSFCRKHLILCS